MDITSSYVLNRICETVQQEMAADKLKKDEIDWTVNAEVLFFYALFGHKPVGINRHFMMVLIHKKFTNYIKREISTKVLWDHLDSMYDMAALNESEVIPFPNEEVDFELPDDCYDLLYSKYGIKLEKSGNNSEASRDNDKNSASSSKSSRKPGPKSKQIASSPGTSKSNFASPVLNKPYKSHTTVKSETKTSEVPQKVKTEGPSTKASKIKPSSSPLTSKTLRSESVSEDDSPDVVTIKKSSKSERGGSPATLKKPAKIESSEKNLAKKSSSKTELTDSGLKLIKAEVSDGSAKKVRSDKDVAYKKGKTVSSSEVPPKKLKVDGNSMKKKNETESTSRKNNEPSLAKQIKAEVKSLSRGREMSTPSPSGSRKSSPVVKIKGNESNKKVKRVKIEESSKKATPSGPKRRRP